MDIVNETMALAQREYAKHDDKHQWSHAQEVLDVALKLASHYPDADLEIIKLAAIFHDVIYDSYETHVEDSLDFAEKTLCKLGYPKDRIQRVLNAMISHSGPHRKKLGDTGMIEGKIMYDADKFTLAKSPEGYKKYYDRFYLDETRGLLNKSVSF